MSITKDSVKGMMCKHLFTIKENDSVIEKTPRLKKMKVFSNKLDLSGQYEEKAMRYMMYMYDKASPFVKDYIDSFSKRQEEVMKFLKIKVSDIKKNDNFTKLGECIMLFKNEGYRKRVMAFWLTQHAPILSSYFTIQNQLFKTLEVCAEPITSDDPLEKMKSLQIQNKLIKEDVVVFTDQLATWGEKLFAGDTNLEEVILELEDENTAVSFLESLT